MATRRKSKAKKAARRKAPARKKTARRKAARKKAGRKKADRKKAGHKKAGRKKAVRKKGARRTAKKKAAPSRASAMLSLARKIVRATVGDPSQFSFGDLYAEGCTSTEATGETVTGFGGLEQKLRQWEAMQEHTTWKPRNVFVADDAICIEWDAQVKLRDGRVVDLTETAVHEVKDGKIVAERYYYNPLALAPPEQSPPEGPS